MNLQGKSRTTNQPKEQIDNRNLFASQIWSGITINIRELINRGCYYQMYGCFRWSIISLIIHRIICNLYKESPLVSRYHWLVFFHIPRPVQRGRYRCGSIINRQLARTDLTSRPTDADSLNGTCRKADHCFTTIRTEVTTTTVYLLHATAIGIPRWLLWLLATFARIPGTMLTFVLTDCARV